MIQIPKDGYWHCKVEYMMVEYCEKNMSFDTLIRAIISPYKQKEDIIIGGHVIKNKFVQRINIYHSNRKNFLDTEISINNLFKYIKIDNKQNSKKSQININNINQQQQMQSQAQQISIEQIVELQDTFAELRKELKTNKNIDCEEMKETQDALDELSQNSTIEQKNKAFTKLRRFINTVSSVIDKTSKAFELFEKLKKIGTIIGLIV